MSRNKIEGRYAGRYKGKHYRTFQKVQRNFYIPWSYMAYSESAGKKINIQVFRIRLFNN